MEPTTAQVATFCALALAVVLVIIVLGARLRVLHASAVALCGRLHASQDVPTLSLLLAGWVLLYVFLLKRIPVVREVLGFNEPGPGQPPPASKPKPL